MSTYIHSYILYIYTHIYFYTYISASGVIWFPFLFMFYWASLAWRMMQLVPVNRSCFWQLMLHEPPVYIWKLSPTHVQSLALYFLNNSSFGFYISILVPSFSPPPVSPTCPPHPGPQPFFRVGMASYGSQEVCHSTGGRSKALYPVSWLNKVSFHREWARKVSSCTRDTYWFHGQWSHKLPKPDHCHPHRWA